MRAFQVAACIQTANLEMHMQINGYLACVDTASRGWYLVQLLDFKGFLCANVSPTSVSALHPPHHSRMRLLVLDLAPAFPGLKNKMYQKFV